MLAGLLLFGLPLPARAGSNLEQELAVVAGRLAQLVKGRGEEVITVGQFTGPAQMRSSAGPVITKMLGDELAKLNIAVKPRANLEVRGEYVDVEDKQSRRLAIKLKGRVLDRTGAVLVEFERGIFGDATISALLGLTTELPANGDAKTRDDKLRDSIDKPKTALSKSIIKAGKDSPYAIEILVKPRRQDYAPRNPKEQDGLAFVPIQRGEVYAIRLVNDSPHEASVTLTIDGLNVFTFSDVKDAKTKGPKYTVLIVSPKESVVIKGWHRTNEVSEEFLVTEYAKSAAGELKSTEEIGTITAVFAACWPKDGEPPADEPTSVNDRSRAGDATGRGQQFHEKFTEVERHFGVVRGTVSVRYTKADAPDDLPPDSP